MALHMAKHRVADRRLPELARHGDVLGVIQVLIAEENHFPLQERVPHFRQLRLRQRPREVHAPNLRADMQGQRNDFDGGRRCGRLCLLK